MSSHLLISSVFVAGVVASTDRLELSDTIGFMHNKDFVATTPTDGDLILDFGATLIDPEVADMFEVAEDKAGTRLKTTRTPDARVNTGRKLDRRTTAPPTKRLRTGDRTLDAGKIGDRNDIIQGLDRCCTIEAN